MIVLFVFPWERTVVFVMLISLILLLLFIAARKIRQRVMSGTPDLKNFCVLYPLEQKTVSGEIEIYFTNDLEKTARIIILDVELNEILEIAQGDYSPGGNIIRFDTSVLDNGDYYYCLVADNQKTMKKMHVQHA